MPARSPSDPSNAARGAPGAPPEIRSAYAITETLVAGRVASVYRAVRLADGRPVVLKVLDPRRCRRQHLEQLQRELEIGTLLGIPAVVRPLALETHRGTPALVLEDFGGRSLDGLLGAPMDIEPFLALATRIAGAVEDVHRKGVVHKDLKPHNILVSLATGEVKITDLGLASRLPSERRPASPPRLIEGSLPYLSPEQTGRTNRATDSRADLYALGVTFYEMLTGRLPFEAHDPGEWVHCHVARAPPSPAEIVPDVPDAIARIVRKLLAKMPEDRYQTARGLRLDLERCLASLREHGKVEPFTPGERDVSDRLRIPQKLYGREGEIATLREAWGRVVATGGPELVLVRGRPGIGKSALVQELYRPIVRARALFLSGKFDQYRRDVPYATLVQAFREVVLEILAETDEEIARCRQRILDALGINAQLVVDAIPSVELVVGRRPPPPELPPAEAQRRFRAVLQRFIAVFAREDRPIALFLDDLQWADPASLALLPDLVGGAGVRHLLVIGAYRDCEVTAGHPLLGALDGVRRADARVSEIVLGPLSRGHLAELAGDALRCGREAVAPLADLVHDKTAGNPFFAIQFLTALDEERLIELDPDAGVFRWEVAKIRAKGFTDNVVDLMVQKLERLPEGTQEALKMLACLGSAADAALLAAVRGGSVEDAHADLWEAVRAGLVLRMDGAYRFLHDRVQEAAYSRIPEGDRAAVHLGIGRLLASRAAPGEIEEKVFEIVNQLDRGAALITSREERDRVAELNLVAGERAKRSTAHASALAYLAAGAAMLGDDGWERRYALAFALELHRAECEYLTGALEAAEERLSALSRRARDIEGAAAVTCARLALYTTQDRSDRAVDACLAYLLRVGVRWSPHPTDDEVRREYERLWAQLGGRSIDALVDLPPMTDLAACATLEVLSWTQSPALFTDRNLHSMVIGRMVNLSLEHGNGDASCLAYVYLGMILGPRFGDPAAGFRFGKLGCDLLEKHDGPLRFKARVYLDFGHRINPWTRHLREGIAPVRRAFDEAQESGDLTCAAYAKNCLITLLLAEGAPLGDVQREAEDALAFVHKARFGLVVDIVAVQLQLVRTLRGLTPDLSSFDDAGFDERRFEQHVERDPRLAIAACWYWVRKLQGRFLAGDLASAMDAAARAEALLWTSGSFLELAEYHFYGALARAARCDGAPAEERPRHLAALAARRDQLSAWAESCPENFGGRAALVSAEIARVGGEAEVAARLYERALESARASGFVHDEAIAFEAAARFHRAQGFDLVADTYLREAADRYRRWGADGKVKQLARQAPRLFEPTPLAAAATITVGPEQLDLLSVIKASQVISSAIVLDDLVRTLLAVALEQGGAQRAILLQRRDKGLSIEAEATLDAAGAVLGSEPVASSERVPASLVHYALRTKERVILHDAAADAGRFSGDGYFARRRPRSVLCMPILRQAEVTGLLYLENDLLAGAFTPDRLAALELVAAQAAISLENARLLAGERAARAAAEEAVRARREFLTVASHELNTPVTSLMLAAQAMRRAITSGRGLDPQTMDRLVEVVSRAGDRLTRLVGDLLDVSRIEAGRLPLDLGDVDLGALVREVVERHGPALARARCPVTVHDAAPIVGRWDRARIDQVVSHLLSNAAKFGAGEPIEIFVGVERGAAHVAVRDHGIGVAPDRIDRIFERFERGVSEQHYGGLGLGLYLCRRIAEDHGGSLRGESGPGAGATFTLELPLPRP